MLKRRGPGKLIVMSLALTLLACGASDTSGLLDGNFSGIYSVTESRSQARCAPLDLPPPVSTDTAQYIQPPSASSVASFNLRIDQRGASISMTPLDAAGKLESSRALTGSVDMATRVASTSRSLSRMEGLRQNGHSFTATETMTASSAFLLAIGTPSGEATGALDQTFGVDTYVFRDGGPSGPIFTTCVVADTISGGSTSR